ncbi:methyltransferase [Psychrobacter sp. DM4]|uniref:methyltransferase n=1 Tax=Psychrobacter sp. DM4 TaxID=3440637 RepID=UPI003F5089B4
MQIEDQTYQNNTHQTTSSVEQESEDKRSDRSFDDIADHFAKKVYGGLKGDIRLAVLRRDIFEYAEDMSKTLERPLRILDVGAGLAQIAIELAALGHTVAINDISANMLDKAKASIACQDTLDNTTWHACAYQKLEDKLAINKMDKFDLILCHALLEWLAEPSDIMRFFDRHLTDCGALSLCFYNPASFVYRNLIMGNFNLLENPDYKADNKKSLTPNYPVAKVEVESWLQQHEYQTVLESGLRVFHDYAPLKRGGHNNPEDVIRMELRYSNQEPFKHMGRYLHILARRL